MDFPNVNEQREQEDKLSMYAKQQGILLQISFLFNSADDFIKQVSDALYIIGNYTDVSHIYLFEDLKEKKASALRFEWYNRNHIANTNEFTHLSYRDTPSWKEYLHRYGRINGNDVGTMPEDIKMLINSQKAISTLVIPLSFKGEINGFIGFDDHKKHKNWENTDLEFIITASNIISHAFDRHYAIQELKETLENQHRINQELVRQNNDLQQFTYIVSHNLRAPIANLLGLVSLYRPNEPTHEVNKVSMENIKTVSHQLDLIARDLNEIVEIKEHLIAETKENVYLEEELKEIFDNLERQIYSAQAQIEIDFTKVSHIFTIRKYMNSILLHLLSNALKYKHPDRNPMIRLSDDIIDNFICFTIKDNGLGIDLKKNANKIFGLHKRFHSHVGGRGVGLYLVKLQTEALGGWIEVESQPEQGSVFKVYLPK